MTDAKPNDNDAEYLLPPEFRKSWVAIPKHSLYQILAFGFFLGAALSLLVVGWIQNVSWMRRAPILVFAFFGLLNFLLRKRNRRTEEAAKQHAALERARNQGA